MRNKRTIELVLAAMFTAMVFVATRIGVPFPGAAGGYVHIGTLTMLVVAMRFGKVNGAIAGGIGMALFDVFSEYYAWAPGTFVVRLSMGYIVGFIAYDNAKGQGGNVYKNVVAWVLGLVIMIVGYYFYEAIFLTNFELALLSIWGNVLQFVIGVAAFPIVYALRQIQFDMIEE
jgi:uncharacterized membrane protein